MTIEEKTKFPINDWELLPIEVYKKSFEEVKESFSIFFLETTNITQRAYNLLIAFSTFIIASGIYVFNKHGCPFITFFLGVLSVYNILFIFWIFKGHDIHYSGTDTSGILTADFEGDRFDEDKKIKLMYKNLIYQYRFKIFQMRKINAKRSSKYDFACISSIIILICVACYLGAIW
jgi:hypothetical protein